MLGATLGRLDGLAVVGLADGDPGVTVGAMVAGALLVGTIEGVREGCWLGERSEGLKEGRLEGCWLGERSEGVKDGLFEGFWLGLRLGEDEGQELGLALGLWLGELVRGAQALSVFHPALVAKHIDSYWQPSNEGYVLNVVHVTGSF